MNQFMITEGGLKLNNLNLNLTESGNSDSLLPDETVDILSDFERVFFEYTANKDFKEFLKLAETFSKVMRGSFKDLSDILETQISNHELNHTGWTFLLNLVTYLYEDGHFDYTSNADCTHLKIARIKLGTMFSYPSFRSPIREEDQTDDTKFQTEKLRFKEYNDFLDKTGLRSHTVDLIDGFLTPIYHDIILTYKTIELFFFDNK